jgi:hypothetical protein
MLNKHLITIHSTTINFSRNDEYCAVASSDSYVSARIDFVSVNYAKFSPNKAAF